MDQPYHPIDTQHVLFLLRQWLKAVSPPAGVEWLDDVRDSLNEGAMDGAFFDAFAAVPKRVGHARLALAREEMDEARKARTGWHPQRWTADTAARAMLLLSYDDSDPDSYGDMLTGLLKEGHAATSAALYRALPLLPYPERHVAWATAATRSNHRDLFEALAVCNPYPAERFDEAAWNSLVMKAVFLGVPLVEVEGLERRANHVLAHELRDYAHQRAAAGHPPSPAIWQAIGDYATGPLLDDMERMINSKDPAQRQAASLVLCRSHDPRALRILADHHDLRDAATSGRLTWEGIETQSLRAAG